MTGVQAGPGGAAAWGVEAVIDLYGCGLGRVRGPRTRGRFITDLAANLGVGAPAPRKLWPGGFPACPGGGAMTARTAPARRWPGAARELEEDLVPRVPAPAAGYADRRVALARRRQLLAEARC